jgi:hypothetical protein
MRSLLLFLSTFTSELPTALFQIRSEPSEAVVVMNEVSEQDSPLSNFYDRMKARETGAGVATKKTLHFPHQRLRLSCAQTVTERVLTSCTFVIKDGPPLEDLRTTIVGTNDAYAHAKLKLSQDLALEFFKSFETGASGSLDLKLLSQQGIEVLLRAHPSGEHAELELRRP